MDEEGRQVGLVSCCPHYLAWQSVLTAVLIGQGRVVPFRGCALIELWILQQRKFNVCLPSFPATAGKEEFNGDCTLYELRNFSTLVLIKKHLYQISWPSI